MARLHEAEERLRSQSAGHEDLESREREAAQQLAAVSSGSAALEASLEEARLEAAVQKARAMDAQARLAAVEEAAKNAAADAEARAAEAVARAEAAEKALQELQVRAMLATAGLALMCTRAAHAPARNAWPRYCAAGPA